jgi:diadenylate cyclase
VLEPLQDIGITGALDIALMAVLVYLGLIWLQRRRAGNVLRGLVVLGLGYLGARLVGLQLVVAAMEGFFVVAFLAAVLLYRDEVRRIVERVARFSRRRSARRPDRTSDRDLRAIVDTSFALANENVGVLIVVEGEEPIDPHVNGGHELDAVISRPLLESIFDSGSDGHDGAVLLQNGRLSRLGTRLPLSTNFDALGATGTRHAAAVGLTELCDALCVVVSEERGQVSIALRGELRPLTEPAQLETELRGFLAEESGRSATPPVTFDGTLAALAGLVAFAAWLVLVYGARPTQRSYVVPVEVADAASGLDLTVLRPDRVRVTLGGPLRDFYFVSDDDVRVIVSVARLSAGPRALDITAADVTLPPNLVLRGVSPKQVTLRLDAKASKSPP